MEIALPVANFMSNCDAQVKACVLSDYTAPFTGARPTQLCYPSDLLVPTRQHQIIPVFVGGRYSLLSLCER